MTKTDEPTVPKQVPHFNWRDCISTNETTPPELLVTLDSYFAPFAAPQMHKDGNGKSVIDFPKCLKCDEEQSGIIAGFVGSGFRWGIVHGEGRCGSCGWPARMHHYIKDDSGQDVFSITNFLLQYHPDHVGNKAEADAA